MKGIVLAGGSGTRLYPMTKVVNKQLLPIHDKPMIYYPMSILMLADIRDILVISTPQHLPFYEALLGDGSQFGLRLSFAAQERPGGLAEAFIVGKDFIGDDPVAMILGDNLLFGNDIPLILKSMASVREGAQIYAYRVGNPEQFGVVEFDASRKAIGLEEKPKHPKSHWAVIGLYAYGPEVVEDVKTIQPSARGELEITDLNRIYLERGNLSVELLGRGVAWLDTGTPAALTEASSFIHTLEARQGLKVACLEEIAFVKQWISHEEVERSINAMGASSSYAQYLRQMLDDGSWLI